MYEIRFLTHSDINQISECIKVIKNESGLEKIFIIPTCDYINTIINGYGQIAGVFFQNKLIGMASIVFPKRGRHNLGYLLGLTEEDLLRVVQLEHIFIHTSYRRKNLAVELINFLINDIDTKHSIMLSTISPTNFASLSLAFKFGMKISMLSKIYGVDRYLLSKNFVSLSRAKEKHSIEIYCTQSKKIREILNNGYYGVSFIDGISKIRFMKCE